MTEHYTSSFGTFLNAIRFSFFFIAFFFLYRKKENILHGLADMGFETPSSIQEYALKNSYFLFFPLPLIFIFCCLFHTLPGLKTVLFKTWSSNLHLGQEKQWRSDWLHFFSFVQRSKTTKLLFLNRQQNLHDKLMKNIKRCANIWTFRSNKLTS